MATAKLNELLATLSGRIGDLVLSQSNGKIVLRKLCKTTKPPSADQLANRARFKAAAAYARDAQAEPQSRAAYDQLRMKSGQSVYHLALADYLNPPRILGLSMEEASSTTNGLIRVQAEDVVQVVGVELCVKLPDGTQLQSGAAHLDTESGLWVFDPEQLIPA